MFRHPFKIRSTLVVIRKYYLKQTLRFMELERGVQNDIGVIDNVNSSVTNSTVANGWQEFIWTITNGSCPATSDTVHGIRYQETIDRST
jgi:hypothetical protein